MEVYRRKDGNTWGKLNDEYQIPVIVKDDGSVMGNGVTEKVNPNEIVKRI